MNKQTQHTPGPKSTKPYGIDMVTMRISGPDLKLVDPVKVMAMCNAHDELVAALRSLLRVTPSAADGLPGTAAAIAAARSAMAKVVTP